MGVLVHEGREHPDIYGNWDGYHFECTRGGCGYKTRLNQVYEAVSVKDSHIGAHLEVELAIIEEELWQV